MPGPRFLALDEMLSIHADQLRRYGGAQGVRDVNLLESAISMPRATFDGRYLHESIEEIAAAYLFHIARNHPFVDGNKRTALAAMLTFLWLAGKELIAPPDELYDLVIGVAEGRRTKSEVAVFVSGYSRER